MALRLEPGGTLKHYRIVGLLGRGGMGEVYAAEDTRLGRKVAIKVLPPALAADPERLRRFTQEVKATSALNHPAILTIYDVDEVDGQPFLVTEFIAGQTLRDRLRQQELPLRDAIEITGQVAGALSAAHAAGIVHRDVKPENIMVRDDGHAKLVDFGLAKIEGPDAGSLAETVTAAAPLTTPGIVMGTTTYMSPEQARGLPVDARSDIFSLGVVLYEMASGRPPFQGETPSDLIAAILHFDPPAVPDLPPELEHTLRKALEKDRDERHQTARDLAADLKRLRRHMDFSAGVLPRPSREAAASWTPTPRSGGAATRETAPGATAPATQAEPVSTAATRSSRLRWIVAAGVAIVVVGILALSLGRRFGGDSGTGEGSGTGNARGITIEKVSGLGLVMSPALSQDGKLLAYIGRDGTEHAIWLRQMATGSVVKVVGPTPNEIRDVQFTPDGNFLFYNEVVRIRPFRYRLMSAPAFGGTAREVAEGRFLRASFAPDGTRLVATRLMPAADELVVMNADGTAPSVIATRTPPDSSLRSASWSPSGAYLALIVSDRVDNGFRHAIQIMRPDGSDVRTLAPPGTELFELAWATTDETLVALGGGQLQSIRASDGRVEPITAGVNNYGSFTFSPVTRTIATSQSVPLGSIWVGAADRPEEAREVPGRLTENDGATGLSWLNDNELVFTRRTDVTSLWTMKADGTGARRLTEGASSIEPIARRDGRVVLFGKYSPKGGIPDLHWLDVADGRVTRVPNADATAVAALSPDGRTVYFQRVETTRKLLSMPLDGGTATSLLDAPIFDLALSPDGTQLAVVTNTGVGTPRTISVLPATGGPPRAIFTTASTLTRLRWYPSGRALVLLMLERGQGNLFKLDVASGQLSQLTRFTRGFVWSPEISPDGRRIAYARGVLETDLVLVKLKPN